MIRCLIVDDSPTFRTVLRELLATAAGVEVVGEAGDGDEAIRQVLALRPDVVTMDVRMPRRDGLAAIREIMRIAPTPIVVVSAAASDSQEGISFQALKLGAVEVLDKPQALAPARFAAQADAIRQAVRAVAGLKLVTRRREPEPPAPSPAPGRRCAPSCVGVVASTGGPPALARVLGALPRDFPVPVMVVQHIAPGFTEGLVRWLSSQCVMPVRLARRGDALEPGTVIVAPDDHHLLASLGRVRLDAGPAVKGLRPSGTALLASLAREYGAAAAGIVLTGMGDDGAAGLRLMRERGATTWAQGPSSSVVYGMPRVAFESGAAELQLELDEIAPALVRLVGLDPSSGVRTGALTPVPFARRPRVLVVEDSETVLQSERALLVERYEVLVARDGREGLEAARRHRPDVVLLDHELPRLTGADVLRALRADPATRAMPVIIVSSETEPAIVDAWWKAGCQAVVAKPFLPDALLAALRRVLA